jgi:hypothetical protein
LLDEAGLEIEEMSQQGGLWRLIGHKVNSYLAFRVARIGGVAQSLGKLGHEATASAVPPRLWTLPFVGASMVAISAAARVLDLLLVEPDEAMSFMVLARRR